MTNIIHVREYSLLTTGTTGSRQQRIAVAEKAHIPQSAFSWLLDQQARFTQQGVPLIQMEGRQALRLDSYVGVLKSPCGTVIEILPKIQDKIPDEKEAIKLRMLLVDMIRTSLHLPKRDMGAADLQLLKYPLSEWLIYQYLLMLDELVKKGIRFDYDRVEDEERFLRGQLHVSKQIRQPLGRQHLFQIRHDIYTPDRPENRLLKTALNICRTISSSLDNWKLASELSHHMDTIPESRKPEQDFAMWEDNRLMQHYRAIRPWCELIIQRLNPTTQVGKNPGISLLFPMEKLFEDYVAKVLKKQFPGWKITTQVQHQHLCKHKEQSWFRLKPDLCLEKQDTRIIMDTKWKLLNSNHDDKKRKYNLKESDFYQLFAYGHKYQDGAGDMVLVYPKHPDFGQPLPCFKLGDNMKLWVMPFDLESKQLIQHEEFHPIC
jgi:5-methylcytosine-specific restriction enzyme subunit McrC